MIKSINDRMLRLAVGENMEASSCWAMGIAFTTSDLVLVGAKVERCATKPALI